MSDEEELQTPVKPKYPIRRIGIYAAVLLFVFLLGFVPMWFKARENAKSLAVAEKELTLFRMQNHLASAVFASQDGDYEPARLATSQFFNSLRTEVDKSSDSSLTQAQKDGVQPLFAGRDDIITLLARGDPAAAGRLSDLYAAYRKIMSI